MSATSVRWTAGLLLIGSLASAILFAAGFVVGLAGNAALGATVSNAGVIVLLVTPAAGLVSTVFELRRHQPQASVLAVGVLAVLAMAVGVALFAH